MEIYRANSFKTSSWSGGTTTELFIYPESASYAKRNFLFRLSTATVETETSLFTELPKVSRTLMVLDGKTELTHRNEYAKMLHPFESDNFRGEWLTTSKGKCVDFNLMCCEGTQGMVRHQKLEKGVQQLEFKGKLNFIFLFRGILSIQDAQIQAGDLVKFSDTPANEIVIEQVSDLISVEIFDI